VTKSPAKLLI